jgi:TPR repeat protein
MSPSRQHKASRRRSTDDLFVRASQQEEQGKLRSAFRLYLAAVEAGNRDCQINLGYCYDTGTGVRRNRSAALYWYKRAYRRGEAVAANNIGTVWRDEGQLKRALSWFEKACALGDEEAHLEIGKHYLQNAHDYARAIRHLEKVRQSRRVTEAGQEEAARLLGQAKRKLNR